MPLPLNSKYSLELSTPPKGHEPWATPTTRQMHPQGWEKRWAWDHALSLPSVPVRGQPGRHFSKNTRSQS